MATSSSDCGANGFCLWEWKQAPGQWVLIDNRANNGFLCVGPPNRNGNVEGEIVLVCAEPASS